MTGCSGPSPPPLLAVPTTASTPDQKHHYTHPHRHTHTTTTTTAHPSPVTPWPCCPSTCPRFHLSALHFHSGSIPLLAPPAIPPRLPCATPSELRPFFRDTIALHALAGQLIITSCTSLLKDTPPLCAQSHTHSLSRKARYHQATTARPPDRPTPSACCTLWAAPPPPSNLPDSGTLTHRSIIVRRRMRCPIITVARPRHAPLSAIPYQGCR